MDGTPSATSPVGDVVESRPEKETAPTVPPGFDAFSRPSTSTYNPSDSPEIPNVIDADDFDGNFGTDFNDDAMQGVILESSVPYVGSKEPLSALADEFKSGSSIMLQKIKLLGEKYAALRRTRGDGNCFYRGFMFSYLEHILMTQDRNEVKRVLAEIEQTRQDLDDLGYTDFTYDDFFNNFTELLQNCLQGTDASLSLKELLEKACDQVTSNCAVMFLRFVTSAIIQKRAKYFAPFISDMSVLQFCKKSVEPMGEESEEVHIIAVCDALGVPIRVVYLDSRSGNPKNPTANHHDFFPSANKYTPEGTDTANASPDISDNKNLDPFVTLLYRPGHYDILYPI